MLMLLWPRSPVNNKNNPPVKVFLQICEIQTFLSKVLLAICDLVIYKILLFVTGKLKRLFLFPSVSQISIRTERKNGVYKAANTVLWFLIVNSK